MTVFRRLSIVLASTTVLVPALGLPPAQAQSRGVDMGVAIGLGLLGGVLNGQPGYPRGPQAGNSRQPATMPDASLKEVQEALNARGFDAGLPNGKISEKTTIAIADFQRANGFPATGRITRAQIATLLSLPTTGPRPNAGPAAGAQNGSGSVEDVSLQEVQAALNARGYNAGVPNGKISEQTTIAIADFQRTNGFPGTGRITRAQIAALRASPIENRGQFAANPASQVAQNRPNYPQSPQVEPGVDPSLKEVQEALVARGYDAGVLNGKLSERTTIAIADFQRANNFPATGRITKAQIAFLLSLPLSPSGGFSAQVPSRPSASNRQPRDGYQRWSPPQARAATSPYGAGSIESGSSLLNGTVAAPIAGVWDGRIKCRNYDDRRFSMRVGTIADIAALSPPRMRGQLEAADRPGRIASFVEQTAIDSQGVDAQWTAFIGQYVEETQSFRFVELFASRNIDGGRLGEIALRYADNAITGEITGSPCASLAGSRPEAMASPERSTVPARRDGGSFYKAANLDSRCTALIQWSAIVAYADRKQTYREKRLKAAALFADNEFIPVFGMPFEYHRETNLGNDLYTTMRECEKDPLMKSRIQPLQAVLGDIAEEQGFDWSAKIYLTVLLGDTRAALNKFASARSRVSTLSDPIEKIAQLSTARSDLDGASLILPDQKKAALVKEIDGIISDVAETVYESERKKLKEGSPPEQLRSIHKMRQFKLPVAVHLSDEARKRATASLLADENVVAHTIFASMAHEARDFTETEKGLQLLNEFDAAGTYELMSGSAASNTKAKVASLRSEFLDKLAGEAEVAFKGLEENDRSSSALERLEFFKELRRFRFKNSQYLSTAAREKASERLDSKERATASPIFDESIRKARALPPTVEGIAEMKSVDTKQLFSLLSPRFASELSNEWANLLREKESMAIEAELATALAFPRDGSGLELGGNWFLDFKKRWIEYQSSEFIAMASKKFLLDRKARLRESLPAFAAAIQALDGASRGKFRDKYLLLQEDESDPVALEYDLSVAGI